MHLAAPAPSGVAFLGVSEAGYSGSETTHAITLPTEGGVGDVDIVLFRIGVSAIIDDPQVVITPPSGWTVLRTWGGIASLVTRKRESGDPATISFGTDVGRRSVIQAVRVGGAHGDVEATSFVSFGNSMSITPSWGSAENGYLSFGTNRRTDQVYVPPSGYGDMEVAVSQEASSSTFQAAIASARRIATNTTESGVAWSLSSGSVNQGVSTLVAVRPA